MGGLEQAVARLAEIPASTRRIVLGALALTSLDHVDALLALSHSPRHHHSARALLRTLIESWIKFLYVLNDEGDARARGFILKSAETDKTFFSQMLELLGRWPEGEERLRQLPEAFGRDEMNERLRRLDEEIGQTKKKYNVPQTPSLRSQATQIGPEIELVYIQIYGYLLSDSVHSGANATVAPRLITASSQPRRASPDTILKTAKSMLDDMSGFIDREIRDWRPSDVRA